MKPQILIAALSIFAFVSACGDDEGTGGTGNAGNSGAGNAAGMGGGNAGTTGDGAAGLSGSAGTGTDGSTGAIGDPCTSADTCPAGGSGTVVCITDWPGGYCAVDSCEAHGHDCPNDPGLGGTATTGGKCVLAGATAQCLALCATTADCRDGYDCVPKTDSAGHGEFNVCYPSATGTGGSGGMGTGGGSGGMGTGGGSGGMGTGGTGMMGGI